MSFGTWLSNAVNTAGKAAGSMQKLVHTASGVVKAVEAIDPDLVKQLPDLVNTVHSMVSTGNTIVGASEVLSAAVKAIPKNADASGFYVATQLLQRPVAPHDLERIRGTLAPTARLAFDMGVSAHIGRVAHPPPPAPPPVQAAYIITKGAQGASEAQKVAIVGAIAANPEMRPGAAQAIVEVAHTREGWVGRFLHWLGLRP